MLILPGDAACPRPRAQETNAIRHHPGIEDADGFRRLQDEVSQEALGRVQRPVNFLDGRSLLRLNKKPSAQWCEDQRRPRNARSRSGSQPESEQANGIATR
jgi:hypothetical protein